MLLSVLVSHILLVILQQPTHCDALSIFSLSPQTYPEEIVAAQLSALKKDDMQVVFDFASPGNKANVNNDLDAFDRMVRRGAYNYLIGHKEAAILLTMTTPTTDLWQGLVRVVPADDAEDDDSDEHGDLLSWNKRNTPSEPTKEYWWTLTRCKAGRYKGCFMVDAVIPNK